MAPIREQNRRQPVEERGDVMGAPVLHSFRLTHVEALADHKPGGISRRNKTQERPYAIVVERWQQDRQQR